MTFTHCPHCSRVWTADEIIEQTCEACPYPHREADAFHTANSRRHSEADLVAMMLIEGRYVYDRPQIDRGVARDGFEEAA